MKLYLVIQSMDGGGAQRVLSILANHWSLRGYEVTLATFRNEHSFYPLENRVKHLKLGLDSQSIAKKKVWFDNLFRINTLTKSIKEEQADVVISFMTTANILATLASKRANVPIVIAERTNYNFLNSRIWRIFRRMVYPFSDALVVLSTYDKEKYAFHKNSHIIYNPIALSCNHREVKREKIILAVGRLEYLKGFDLLIDAFSRLKQEGWKVIIVGEGKDREALEAQVIRCGLEASVEMPGATQNMEPYYRKASIFVLSSRIEGFPNVLIEAMGYGAAPIAMDCLTGPRDIIQNKKNGLLVEVENSVELSIAMESLMDNPDQLQAYATHAKNVNSALMINTISDKWLGVISMVIKNKGV